MSRDRICCSFCGKAQDEVATLVAGPGPVFICNECHALMAPIMARLEKSGAQGALGPKMTKEKGSYSVSCWFGSVLDWIGVIR